MILMQSKHQCWIRSWREDLWFISECEWWLGSRIYGNDGKYVPLILSLLCCTLHCKPFILYFFPYLPWIKFVGSTTCCVGYKCWMLVVWVKITEWQLRKMSWLRRGIKSNNYSKLFKYTKSRFMEACACETQLKC